MARNKGCGTLVKRGKYWMAKWVVDGKIYTRTTKCSRKDDAEKVLRELTHPFQVNDDIQVLENLEAKIRNEEVKLSECEDEYANCEIEKCFEKYYKMANSTKIVGSTEHTYDTFIRVFMVFCKEHKLAIKLVKDVTRRDVELFLSHYKTVVCGQRYNCLLAQFKKVWSEFGKMSRHKCFKDNPWSGFKYQSSDPSMKRELTVEELVKVLSLATDENINLLFCIGIYTGLRISDCCSLKWSEVDLIKKTITKIPKKTKRLYRPVVIPIHPVLFNKLEYHKSLLLEKKEKGLAYDEDELYVSHALLRMYNENTLNRQVQKLFHVAGIRTSEEFDGKKKTVVSFHSLRHTFVSMAATAGIPLDVVKNMVGHTTTKMTEHYEHVSQITMANAIAQLPSLGRDANVCMPSRKVTVEVNSEVLSSLSRITSKTPEEILIDYIREHEESHRCVLDTPRADLYSNVTIIDTKKAMVA